MASEERIVNLNIDVGQDSLAMLAVNNGAFRRCLQERRGLWTLVTPKGQAHFLRATDRVTCKIRHVAMSSACHDG